MVISLNKKIFIYLIHLFIHIQHCIWPKVQCNLLDLNLPCVSLVFWDPRFGTETVQSAFRSCLAD